MRPVKGLIVLTLVALAAATGLSAGVILQPYESPVWEVSEWINGNPGSLESQRGRVVVIEFFQLWCPGCNEFSIPLMREWNEKWADREDIMVVSIHTVFEGHRVQTPARLREFVKEKRIRHPVGIDKYSSPDAEVPITMDRFHTGGTPHVAIVDKKGELRFSHFGRFDAYAIEAFVERLAKERASGESNRPRPPARANKPPDRRDRASQPARPKNPARARRQTPTGRRGQPTRRGAAAAQAGKPEQAVAPGQAVDPEQPADPGPAANPDQAVEPGQASPGLADPAVTVSKIEPGDDAGKPAQPAGAAANKLSGRYLMQFQQRSKTCGTKMPPQSLPVDVMVDDTRITARFKQRFLGLNQFAADYDPATGEFSTETMRRSDEAGVGITLKIQLDGKVNLTVNPPTLQFQFELEKEGDKPGWECQISGLGSATRSGGREGVPVR